MPEQEFTNGNGEARPNQTRPAFTGAFEQTEDFLMRHWRENPLQVGAVAAGLGLLVGLLLSRRG